MSGKLTEQKVLRKLGIPDFRHLNKAKVINLASMLDRMDPEVAKKAIEQFPEFAGTTREMLTEYKDIMEKGIASNNESMKAVYGEYHALNEALLNMLNNDNMTFEEKKYVIEQMKEIADKVDKKDSENKKFIFKMFSIAAAVSLGVTAVLAATLGGNSHIESINNDEDDENDIY